MATIFAKTISVEEEEEEGEEGEGQAICGKCAKYFEGVSLNKKKKEKEENRAPKPVGCTENPVKPSKTG